jgi:hypothetical protein
MPRFACQDSLNVFVVVVFVVAIVAVVIFVGAFLRIRPSSCSKCAYSLMKHIKMSQRLRTLQNESVFNYEDMCTIHEILKITF